MMGKTMERTVPKTGGENIELYMRTYYSLLRSTDAIKIETLVETHRTTDSLLHVYAHGDTPDMGAFLYSSLRLPYCMMDVTELLLGQTQKGFAEAGFTDVEAWERVSAPARRRRMHFDGEHTLAAYIASRSDIDDMVPIVTAYQIEWNKMHRLLQGEVARLFLAQHGERTSALTASEVELLAGVLRVEADDLNRVARAWGGRFVSMLVKIASGKKAMALRLVSGSQVDYRRATALWWRGIERRVADRLDLERRPVYFVSSNTHALPNMLTGFALRHEAELIRYIREAGHELLLAEYDEIVNRDTDKNLNNFLYYVLKKYLADTGVEVREQQVADEIASGIYRVPSEYGFDVEAQVIELRKLRSAWMDDRLCKVADAALMAQSDALIVNIDYPLGLAAYEILNRVSENVRLLGVYVMGKAATLNGRQNDVMIPNVIHDEHSQNTYLFNACFTAADVAPYMTFGSVLDNQKAISVPGTFLQNSTYMDVFYREGFTDIEMEGGPYLSSVYESFRPKRHPFNEIVNLYGVSFDVGFLHYASDTPLSKGENLGSNLSYAGVDPTYATAVAIMRRVLKQEAARLRGRGDFFAKSTRVEGDSEKAVPTNLS
jgi:hypothetical protein